MPSNDTKAFLEAILPSDGLRCLVLIDHQDQSFRRQLFFPTTDELAEAALRFDAEFEGTHKAVFHACSNFKSRSRKAIDVLAARAFWLDVDAGPGKPYPDGRAAAEAIVAFARQAVLPMPWLVSSGTGVHCYWPLDRPLEPAEWLRYAAGLKGLCANAGLHAGPERTADIASILRPVGTTHRKGNPLPVRSGPAVGPYSVDRFEVLLSAPAAPARAPVLRPQGPAATGLIARLSNLSQLQGIDFDLLASRCAQMSGFRDSGGNLVEPLWYAGLGVLAKCHDGERVAHQWSSGHPHYDRKETQAKLERARLLTGPPTCQHFEGLNSASCAACPFRGIAVTPLDAVSIIPPADPEVPQPEETERPYTDFSIFAYQKDGSLCIKTETSDGKPQFRKLTSFPIYFASVHTGELRTSQYTYLLRHWLPHEGWQEVEIGARHIFGTQGISLLADAGIVIHHADGFRQFVRESIDRINTTERLKVQYEQFGWKHEDQAFLYGDRLYQSKASSVVACAPEVRLRSQWLRPREAGSAAGWKDAADRLFGKGSESQSFTILASFAAPLMRFLEDEEGGSIVSLVTRDSGTGKTTSLAGAYTVWSTQARGLSITAIDTKVAKGLTLATLGNLPVIYDELQTRDPDELHDTVMMFTNGRDKMRGTQDAQIQHTAASWQTIMFTASNTSLVNAIRSSGRSEAPAFRILEFPIQSGGDMDPIAAGQLKRKLEQNAGHAGDAFLRYLLLPETLAYVRRQLPVVASEIYVRGHFRKEHRFWVRTLGAVGVAAVLVKHLGLVSFNPDRIMQWAVDYFAALKDDTSVAYSAGRAPSLLAQFLLEHLSETLVMPKAARPGQPPQQPITQPSGMRRLSVRRNVDTGEYLINRHVLRDWLYRREVDIRDFLRELWTPDRIVLNQDRNLLLGAGTTQPGGQVHCVVVDGNHPRLTGAPTEVISPVLPSRLDQSKRA